MSKTNRSQSVDAEKQLLQQLRKSVQRLKDHNAGLHKGRPQLKCSKCPTPKIQQLLPTGVATTYVTI